ncbi:MAG: formylglycine-generating enzyme family protein [Calothrix sp. SM1_7_51]|nr:formylglycine-generating enzyme family protein [Calothrix sp. SM1_7_51]
MRYPSANQALEALIETPASLVETQAIFRGAKQEFYQEAESRAEQGKGQLSVFALRILESRRIELGLSSNEASEILQQILRPYREYERKLIEYEQAFIEAVNHAYPFNQVTQKDLQDYRLSLGLHSKDIIEIENRVLQSKQLEYEHQPQKIDRLRPELQKSIPVIQTQQFEFQYATVNIKRQGFFRTKSTCKISYNQGSAEYLMENLDHSLTLEMVAIPGGNLVIGSPENEEGRYDSETPQDKVRVQPFFMGKYLITQAQWKAIATLPKVNIDLKSDPSHFKGDKLPVESINWDEAREFCARLSLKLEKSYRLPTEVEWEYACRAGMTTPFCCGETITTDLANFNGDYTYSFAPKGKYRAETSEVGIFPPNSFGLYDMHGNVWEWCQDKWHDNYNHLSDDDESTWLSNNDSDDLFVVRGGSWGSLPRCCRSSRRDKLARDGKNGVLGFRVVFAAPQDNFPR